MNFCAPCALLQDAWVAPNAAVIGKVVLEKGSSVWFNTVIRGDNEPIIVGENSNIQDGCVLHSDMGVPLTIGKNVTVGHMVLNFLFFQDFWLLVIFFSEA
jgi:carbonic anhydrase/acetyltransferase-like protein (isoleucine patch superfamily)